MVQQIYKYSNALRVIYLKFIVFINAILLVLPKANATQGRSNEVVLSYTQDELLKKEYLVLSKEDAEKVKNSLLPYETQTEERIKTLTPLLLNIETKASHINRQQFQSNQKQSERERAATQAATQILEEVKPTPLFQSLAEFEPAILRKAIVETLLYYDILHSFNKAAPKPQMPDLTLRIPPALSSLLYNRDWPKNIAQLSFEQTLFETWSQRFRDYYARKRLTQVKLTIGQDHIELDVRWMANRKLYYAGHREQVLETLRRLQSPLLSRINSNTPLEQWNQLGYGLILYQKSYHQQEPRYRYNKLIPVTILLFSPINISKPK